jgi:hypothetical protein
MLLAGASAVAQAANTDELDVTMQVVEADSAIPEAVIHEIKLPKGAPARGRKALEPETTDAPREQYEGDAHTGTGDAPEKEQGPGDVGGSGPGGGMDGGHGDRKKRR